MADPMIVAFDVDGTLIDADDNPRKDVIALFRAFQWLGFEMWVWSGGGEDYARLWCSRLGLEPDRIMAKNPHYRPDLAIDDVEGADLGLVATLVLPKEESK